MSLQKYKLVFFVPLPSLNSCKAAIFAVGAGRYPGPGNYTEACFQSLGTGQFRPGSTARPNIGTPGELERVEEMKVETICVGRDVVKRAVEALVKVHPYEEVAYEVYKMEDI
ncbi:hypothetical protein EG328_000140 [Venturia inaequalis]|uniref:ATP phosphoribosyltransferase n=1 Tax=Venturia inaequalis TaxID=5025 RepID=A0A8H3VFM0_VENIN|nr:hypothetical protein EG328_000140 [Venturia inaequalis]